jgi:hypothetical protein
VRLAHQRVPWHAQFAAKIKEVVLHAIETVANCDGQVFAQQHPDCAVQFVDGAYRFYSRRVFRDP